MSLRPNIPLHQYRGHVLETAPATEPVTASELRDFLRETATGLPDSEAEDFISEAREMIEEHTGLAMIDQTWKMAIDRWPGGQEQWWDGVKQMAISELHTAAHRRELYLPRYPLSSVDSVTVYDEDSNSTTVTVADKFDVDTYQKPGRLTLKRDETWPVALRASNAIEIVYTSGYGSSASDVPAALRRAVKQAAAYLYSHRGDDCQIGDVLSAAKSLLSAYSVARI